MEYPPAVRGLQIQFSLPLRYQVVQPIATTSGRVHAHGRLLEGTGLASVVPERERKHTRNAAGRQRFQVIRAFHRLRKQNPILTEAQA